MVRFTAFTFLILMGLTASAAQRPNVVFIVADDLGYAELGSFGQKKILTPNLDRIAIEGMRFTQHYAGNAVCATSRCVLMTGRHTGHCYIRTNREVKPEGQLPIPAETVTLAELFKAQGYATGGFGKWGLGPMHSEGDPLAQGFDRFYGYNCQRHAHNFYPRFLWNDHQRITLEGNDRGLTGEQYAPDLYNEAALQFIDDHKDEPFFLYYPTIIPHLAIQVPQGSLNEYKGKWDDPAYDGKHGYLPHPHPRAGYAAMVSHMDRNIQRLFERLEQHGIDDDTIIVFTSDNGPTYDRLGGSDSDFFESAGPLRGLKGSLYEGGIRVPTIVRWPGRIKANAKSDFVSAFYDWMPTLMELIGAKDKIPSDCDGLSFAPALLGAEDEQKEHEFLYWEFPSYGGQQAVRMGKWKGIRLNLMKKKELGSPSMELYNLAEDVGESNDVAASHPEIVEQIETIMAREHVPSQQFPFPILDRRSR